MEHFLIYSDGGSRGNPGPAGCGFVIKSQNPIFNFKFQISNQIKISNDKKEIHGSKYLGEMTNNQAEYNGVVAALEEIVKLLNGQIAKNNLPSIEVFLDSQLIVEQMNGRYKIKNEGLKPLYWKIRELIMDLGSKVSFKHIPREENKHADKLVNEAIDKELK